MKRATSIKLTLLKPFSLYLSSFIIISVVARFANYNAADAHFFADNIKSILRELRAEAGIHDEEEEVDDGEEEEAAPAPARNQHAAQKMWGGMDG